jgi:hypothetical protein
MPPSRDDRNIRMPAKAGKPTTAGTPATAGAPPIAGPPEKQEHKQQQERQYQLNIVPRTLSISLNSGPFPSDYTKIFILRVPLILSMSLTSFRAD